MSPSLPAHHQFVDFVTNMKQLNTPFTETKGKNRKNGNFMREGVFYIFPPLATIKAKKEFYYMTNMDFKDFLFRFY